MPKFVDVLGTAAPTIVGDEAWIDVFANVARVLLASRLRVNDRSVDLCEIEFYLHGDDHPDPFVHRDPMQRSFGRWYFHRVGENYRGGTFKGLDITFGSDGYYGGVLIRSLRTPEGCLINGSSLCVDYLPASTGHRSVSSLATMLSRYSVDASISALSLACVDGRDQASIWQTPRVGLSLARAAHCPQMLDYIARPYRFLSDPRGIRKGRVQLVVALHARGVDRQQIVDLVGVPPRTVDAYVSAYEDGRASNTAGPPRDAQSGPVGLCRLYGWLKTRQDSRPLPERRRT